MSGLLSFHIGTVISIAGKLELLLNSFICGMVIFKTSAPPYEGVAILVGGKTVS